MGREGVERMLVVVVRVGVALRSCIVRQCSEQNKWSKHCCPGNLQAVVTERSLA